MRGWSKSILFTRQDIARLTGVTDGVLAFWIKNGLLISSEGGNGRGSHRKFAPIQVSFAAILGAVQQFGLNISALGDISSILQRGASVCDDKDLHPFSLNQAAEYARQRSDLENGIPIKIWDRDDSKIVVAQSLEDLDNSILEEMYEYDPQDRILAFGKTLTADDYASISAYSSLKYVMDELDWGDPGWLLWQDDNEKWAIAQQTEPGEVFTGFPNADTGIFVAVGRIVRRVWNLAEPSAIWAERSARHNAKTESEKPRKDFLARAMKEREA